jgi:hypothetical protein
MTTDSRIKIRAVPNRPTPTFGNPDLPPEGRLNTLGNPESLRSDGPHNEVIEKPVPVSDGPACHRHQHAALLLVLPQVHL